METGNRTGRRTSSKRHSFEPVGVSPLYAGTMIGASRSTIYRLLGTGQLLAVKRGTATLVLLDSLRAYQASLPPATFGVDRRGHATREGLAIR
jgi:hypothetical protein